MSKEVKKLELFVKEVVSKIKGDDAEALGYKVARKAMAAMEANIAKLNSSKVDAEIKLTEKEEALHNAIYPSKMFESVSTYCSNIASCQEDVNNAKNALQEIEESITYWEEMIKNKF